MEYQLRLTRSGDCKSIAGDDGILQLDNFAQEVVTQKHEKRMSQTLDNEDLKEFKKFAPETNETNDDY